MSNPYKPKSKADKKWFKDYFKKGQPLKENTLYDLLWNNKVVLSGVLYPVAIAKQKELVNARTHSEKLFNIKRR